MKIHSIKYFLVQRILGKIIALLILASCGTAIYSQSMHYLSFELAGSGGIASVNAEQRIYASTAFHLYLREGFSIAPIDKNNGTAMIFPLMVHGIFGITAHRLDIGMGQSLTVTTTGRAFAMMPLSAGYRFQPDNRSYYFRIAYTPIVSYLIDFQWQHWAGISYGYAIGKKK